MKSEIKEEHIQLFLDKLNVSMQATKTKLDRIETVIWKEENRFALFWNKHFGKWCHWKWCTMTVYGKELVEKHSIRYAFQRCDLKETIYKQEQLHERLKYAIQANSSVIFEDSDYRLLSGG